MRSSARAEPDPDRKELERLKRVYTRRKDTDFGDRYTHFDPANLLAIHERARVILSILREHGLRPLSGRDILEVGSGTGFWLREFVHWGADPERVWGVDVDPERVGNSRRRTAPGVRVVVGDGTRSPFRDASFDLVLQATVFSSILRTETRRALAEEMLRVLKPAGLILSYDMRYRNPENRDVAPLPRAEIMRIFPGCRARIRSLTLAPPIARRVAPISSWVCQLLGAVPPLRTHLMAAIWRAS